MYQKYKYKIQEKIFSDKGKNKFQRYEIKSKSTWSIW